MMWTSLEERILEQTISKNSKGPFGAQDKQTEYDKTILFC